MVNSVHVLCVIRELLYSISLTNKLFSIKDGCSVFKVLQVEKIVILKSCIPRVARKDCFFLPCNTELGIFTFSN